jgi:rhodanese-related sulfurtransferase
VTRIVVGIALAAAITSGCSGHRGSIEAYGSPAAPPPRAVPAPEPPRVETTPIVAAAETAPLLPRLPEQPTDRERAPEDAPRRFSLISIDEAKRQFDLGVPFFDARFHEEFNAGHVKGAILFDPTDDSVIGAATKPDWLKRFDPQNVVIIYCGGGDCDSSKIVDAQLREFGFTNVKSFEDGFVGWKAKGYPIEGK